MNFPQGRFDGNGTQMTVSGKTLYLHIGFHKTGTSALQEALFYNADAARASGLIYPTPLSGLQSHIDLAQPLFGAEMPWVQQEFDFDKTYDHYCKIIEEAPDDAAIVLSTEELCRADRRRELVDRVHRKFGSLPGVNTRIVAYRRDPVGFLISLYHHEIRAAVYDGSFQDFVDTHINLNSVRFGARLASWRQVFGPENLILRDYDAAIKRHGHSGIVPDFLEVVGKPHVHLPQAERRVNVGVHPWLVDAYRQLGAADVSDDERVRLRGRTISLSEQLPKVNAANYYLGQAGTRALRERIDGTR